MVSQRGIEANPDKIKERMEIKSPKTVKEVQSLMGKVAALNKFISRDKQVATLLQNLKEGLSMDGQM